jgi:beta-phosphoglucomutase-like phosphatase (HAD superfamily)
MITAFDTKIGKPHPEPFLMGLKKGGNLKPNQALVIENAPLGTESATKAGIFTICVNTGPLDNKILIDAGANIVFQSMPELLDKFPEILKITSSNKNN